MAMKSDFAQKLLHDLRLRKERMAAAQNSSHSNSMSRDATGHRGQKGYAQIKGPESTGSRTGKSFRKSTGGSRSFSVDASQNQIVPYERGRSSEQKGDLSMALTVAFGNGGKMGISGNNAVIKFLQNIGRRSLDTRQMERKGSFDVYNPSNRSSTISNLHITEISKGVQKLNQIIKACSNGFTVNGYSIEVGQELLRGAMDLEESLRMLVNLQEASDNMISAQRKNKIKLLEEDDEEGEDNEWSITKVPDKRQVERPRFSFDKPSKNSQGTKESAKNYIKQHLMALTYPDESPKSSERRTPSTSNPVHHKRSASCVPDFKTHSTSSEAQNRSSVSQSKPEKGRISNVVAKLMGLEELPQREDQKPLQKELSSKRKEGVVSKRSITSAETWNRDAENRPPSTMNKSTAQPSSKRPTRDTRYVLEPDNMLAAPHGGSRRIVPHENDLQELEVAVKRDATSSPHHDISQPNQIPVYCKSSRGQEKEVNKSQINEEKISKDTHERKELLPQKELPHKVPRKHTIQHADNVSRDDAECKEKAADVEKKSTNRLQASKQQKQQGNQELQQLQRLKDFESQEGKIRGGKREQHLARQKLLAGERKRSQLEPMISPKPKNCSTISRKKQPGAVQDTARKKKLMTPTEAMPLKDLVKSTHREGFPQQKTSVQGPVIQENANVTLARRRETPDKLEADVNRRNKTLHQLSRPLKPQSPVLREIEHQENKNISNFEEPTQLSNNQSKEAEAGNNGFNKSEEQGEPLIVAKELPSESKEISSLSSPDKDSSQCLEVPESLLPSDSGQCLEIQEPLLPSDHIQDPAIEVHDVCNDQDDGEQPSISQDAELQSETTLLEQYDGNNEESVKTNNLYQKEDKKVPLSGAEDPLTETEKHLKDILIKSQLFLNTTEALFKLNIPIGILDAGYHNDQDAEAKLTLDCAYEVIRRKGRRQELRAHPFSRVSVCFMNLQSLDDLIKQLCKDFDALNFYGGQESDHECNAADYLRKMLENDMKNNFSDVNCMWDYGWNETTFAFLEKHEIIKDVEKHMLNGLLDEITRDLLLDFHVLV